MRSGCEPDTSRIVVSTIELPMTVLLVDDNEMILITRKLIFERYGYRVITAADGASALAALWQEPAVAVVDYHLPDMDGHKLCEEIKAQRPKIHVVLASGSVPDEASDCPDYVVLKGGSPLELVNRVVSLTKAA
jgi:CheY-like chemotaxis protein